MAVTRVGCRSVLRLPRVSGSCFCWLKVRRVLGPGTVVGGQVQELAFLESLENPAPLIKCTLTTRFNSWSSLSILDDTEVFCLGPCSLVTRKPLVVSLPVPWCCLSWSWLWIALGTFPWCNTQWPDLHFKPVFFIPGDVACSAGCSPFPGALIEMAGSGFTQWDWGVALESVAAPASQVTLISDQDCEPHCSRQL